MLEDIKRTLGEVFGWVTTVHPRGKRTSLIIFALALTAFIVYLFTCSILSLTVAVLYAAIGIFVAFFFRDPYRPTVFKEDEIACPADGKIISIRTEGDDKVLVIRIFLSIFNVHIQRATIDGEVQEIKYTKGKFAFANNPEANNNERNLIKFVNGDKFAYMEQITGAIARRIECWVKPGDKVKAGQYAGMIYFGSQVAVYLPKDKVKITVKEGQNVQGALTVLGLWR